MAFKIITFGKANDKKHKYTVVVLNKETNRETTISFGAYGYSDYTQHNDVKRKELYDARHIKNEDWDDPLTAGFWAKWILWNKPTIKDSIADVVKRFNL